MSARPQFDWPAAARRELLCRLYALGRGPRPCRLDAGATLLDRGTPFRQKAGKSMSRRSGQAGQVFLRHGRWIGRFWEDVPGQPQRKRRAIVLGLRGELTKPEARRKLMQMLEQAGVNRPEHFERSIKPPVTFGDVAGEWRAKRLPQLKLSTQYLAPKLIKRHLLPFFGEKALDAVKTGTINEWIAGLAAQGLEPKTVHNLWKLFRSIVNWHSRQDDEQPRRFYPSLPVIPLREPRWFTPDEVARITQAAQGQYRVLFHLAWASGLRAGELLALHVEDIDLGRGIVHVRRSLYHNIEVTPKTPRSYRNVWIDSATVKILGEHLGDRGTGRVFETRNGTPLEARNVVRQVLYPICDRLGVKRGALHSFRHGRVSHLQAVNVPADFIKSQVGHSSLQMTSRYTHFSDAFAREQVEKAARSWTH